ncbi:hypothetical protein [Fusobacterium polymorphum]|uniref:Uncharacterized protein n=1 Tax=Fusobacterium nucleatum subsp. polymorphum TaxID=76857 RepID=A0A2C6CKU5_FUSNP|nr:hypothetical protein [Fusobacterium polymorphum]PHI16994.1 hypothetical protein CBG56_04970 [Fusobacterium polymorphum]
MSKEIKSILKMLCPLIFGTLVMVISIAILSLFTDLKYQVFDDMIFKTTAETGAKTSWELTIFWISLLLGIFSIIIFSFIKKKELTKKFKENLKLDLVGYGIFIIPISLFLILTQTINFFYFIIALIYILLCFFIEEKEKRYKNLILLNLIYFSTLSVKALTDKLIKKVEIIPHDSIYLITLLLFIIIFYYLKKNSFKNLDKLILYFQFPLPLMLFTYFTNKYEYNNELIKISFSKRYKAVIIFFIVYFVIINLIEYRNKIKNLKKTTPLVTLSTVIIIFIIRFYVEPKFVHYGDFWHWGEESIIWHQIFKKKLILFDEYIGTTGLFPMILGLIQYLLFKGSSFSFLPSLAITNIVWMTIIGTATYFLIKTDFVLFIALFLVFPQYNRTHMLMLSLFVLSNSELIKQRIQWVQMYILLSILSVFYYPINGVAVALGGAVFALIQIYFIIKEKEYLKIFKSKLFWLLNIALILPVIFSLKNTLKLIKIVSLLASSSKLADGRVGKFMAEDWFMKYIINQNLKDSIWNIFVLLLIAFPILISIYFLCIYLLKKDNILKKIKKPEFFILTFSPIAVSINCTYSVMRINRNVDFYRNGPIIIVFVTIMIIFLYKYGNRYFSHNIKIIFISICILIGNISVEHMIKFDMTSFGEEYKNIKKSYKVDGNFEYVNGEDFGIFNLGVGFIEKNALEKLIINREMLDKIVHKDERAWFMYDREMQKIFDLKSPTRMDSPYLTTGLKATQANLESIKELPIFITAIDTGKYYTYRWVIDNKYAIIDYKGFQFWIRSDRYKEIFGDIEKAEEYLIENFPKQNLNYTAFSLGNSIKSLKKLMKDIRKYETVSLQIEGEGIEFLTQKKIKIKDINNSYIDIVLPEIINGNKYDFLYLELSSDYQVNENRQIEILWETDKYPMKENRAVIFEDKNGKLLIPMGLHPAWLYSDVTKIRLKFINMKIDTTIDILKIEFMQLNRERKED